MRTRYLANAAFAFLFSTTLLFASFAIASDKVPKGNSKESAELKQEVVLTATTNAPNGATGTAKLEAKSKDGATESKIKVKVEGLAPGTYTVQITKLSDSNTVDLGTFDVSTSNSEASAKFDSKDSQPLPPGFDPMDIASISILDSGSLVVLTGEVATLNGKFKAKSPVVGGPASPSASGKAELQSKVKNGVQKTKFKIAAKDAPPNAVLTFKINGVDFGTVSTDSKGNLKLRDLPAGVDPEAIVLIQFDEADGTNALTVNF